MTPHYLAAALPAEPVSNGVCWCWTKRHLS